MGMSCGVPLADIAFLQPLMLAVPLGILGLGVLLWQWGKRAETIEVG